MPCGTTGKPESRHLDTGDSRDFMRDKLAWHGQVVRDPGLSALAVRVAGIILDDLNSATGDAWRGQTGIASELSATTRGVQKALAALAAAGHIEITTAKGRGKTNRYRAVLKNTNARSSFQPENTNSRAEKPDENTNSRSEKHEHPFVQTLEESLNPPLSPQTVGPPGKEGLGEGETGRVVGFPLTGTDRRPPPRPGPSLDDIREVLRHRLGAGPFASYVEPAAWRAEDRVLVCPHGFAADRLRQEIGHRALRALDLTILGDRDEHARLRSNVVRLARTA